MIVILKIFIYVLLAFQTIQVFSQPADVFDSNWEKNIPRIVYPEKDYIDLYEATWRIASERVRRGPDGLPSSPYLDENCYEDQIWIWDSCFMVLFSRYASNSFPGLQTLDNFYIPIHDNITTPLRIHLRDNPPLFSWAEYYNYLFSADKERLKYILDDKKYLQKHFEYFNTVKRGTYQKEVSPMPIFLDQIKDNKGKIIGYNWKICGASGMDNTPRGRDCGGCKNIMWVDAISQQALSALYIKELFDLYGDKKEAKKWNNIYKELKKTVNDIYWDEKDGFYYDVDINTRQFCRIKTPASFWAMLAGIPSKKQAERMVKYLKDEKFFGGEFPWPSLSRDDKDYNNKTGDYWRGGIWLPLVYMGTKALEKYGYYELADSLAKKVITQQMKTYFSVKPNTIWECYNPSANEPSTEHGKRARKDFCGWSALGPISLFIENVIGFRDINSITNTVSWSLKKENKTHGIKNLKFGKVITDIVYDDLSSEIIVETNNPFILNVNGKKIKIKSGKSIYKIDL